MGDSLWCRLSMKMLKDVYLQCESAEENDT